MTKILKLLLVMTFSVVSLNAAESTSFHYSNSGSDGNSSYYIESKGSSYVYDSKKSVVENPYFVFRYGEGERYEEVRSNNERLVNCINALLQGNEQEKRDELLNICQMHLENLSTRRETPMTAENILFYTSIATNDKTGGAFQISREIPDPSGEPVEEDITNRIIGQMTEDVLKDELQRLANIDEVYEACGQREILDCFTESLNVFDTLDREFKYRLTNSTDPNRKNLEFDSKSGDFKIARGTPMIYPTERFLHDDIYDTRTKERYAPEMLVDLLEWEGWHGHGKDILLAMQILKALKDRHPDKDFEMPDQNTSLNAPVPTAVGSEESTAVSATVTSATGSEERKQSE